MSTVIRTEKRIRSTFGKIVKWVFIAFNLLMLVWLVGGMGAVSKIPVHSDAERVGQAIGAVLGFSALVAIWFWGDLFLGLFVLLTRGNTIIVEEIAGGYRSGESSVQDSGAGGMDAADAAIARYKQRQQAETNQVRAVPSPTTAQQGFGRRVR